MIIAPHMNVQRFFDEYCCSDCGRSWPVDDPVPPPVCQSQFLDAHGKVMKQVEQIKGELNERAARKK